MMVTLQMMRREVEQAISSPGEPLAPCDVALIRVGLAASVTALDNRAIVTASDEAFAAGATPEQIQEVLSLVSGLGVHTLMASCAVIIERARAAGYEFPESLSPEQQALWDKHVGEDPFWAGFEREVPGFLHAMLQLSADQFVAFFDYCSVPWRTRSVRGRIKELIAMACDATPAHRFMPGFKLHLSNAIKLGAGRLALDETLALAAAAPVHRGTL